MLLVFWVFTIFFFSLFFPFLFCSYCPLVCTQTGLFLETAHWWPNQDNLKKPPLFSPLQKMPSGVSSVIIFQMELLREQSSGPFQHIAVYFKRHCRFEADRRHRLQQCQVSLCTDESWLPLLAIWLFILISSATHCKVTLGESKYYYQERRGQAFGLWILCWAKYMESTGSPKRSCCCCCLVFYDVLFK